VDRVRYSLVYVASRVFIFYPSVILVFFSYENCLRKSSYCITFLACLVFSNSHIGEPYVSPAKPTE